MKRKENNLLHIFLARFSEKGEKGIYLSIRWFVRLILYSPGCLSIRLYV